jgi:hypothetical protein
MLGLILIFAESPDLWASFTGTLDRSCIVSPLDIAS